METNGWGHMANGVGTRSDGRLAWGITSTLLGACLWGFSGTCLQFLFAETELDPILVTCIRELGAGLVFLAVLVTRNRGTLTSLAHDKDSLRRLAVFGTFGLFLNSCLYATTISFTNAGTATVLQSLSIVIALAATCVLTHRPPRPTEVSALVLALAATYLIATHADPTTLKIPLPGLVFGLATAASAAFYTMYPKQLFERWGSFLVTGLGMLQGGVTGLLVCAATGRLAAVTTVTDPGSWLVLAIAILFGTFGAYGLFLHGVSLVGPVAGNMLGAAEPVSATVIGALWLATPFTPSDWAGLVLMVATIVLVALSGSRNRTQRP